MRGVHIPKRPMSAIMEELHSRGLTQVFTEIARRYDVTLKEVMGPRKLLGVVAARQACMWLLNKQRGWSLHRVADLFDRHHVTVLANIRAHETRLAKTAPVDAVAESDRGAA